MKSLTLIIIISAIITHSAFGHGKVSEPPADDSRKIVFPDTAQYETLVFDPHTHSAFSDGHVWPRIRVEESLRDGLDAFAVTEHLEYQPHLEDIPHPDRNRSYEDAAAAAQGSSLLVIPGAEITREAPASHMNAIFITDANKLYHVDGPYDANNYREKANEWPAQNAVDAANEQGAFVFWNHAFWTHDFPNGIPVMPEFHQKNAKAGLLHGIEVANGKNYSEETFQMALDYNLTLIGVSDIHNLIDWDYEPHKGGHRPVTLAFVNERSAEGLKEALFDRRTVVWFKNTLIGRNEYLNPLIEASLSITEASYGNGEILNVTLANSSDADFQLRNLSNYGFSYDSDLIAVGQHSAKNLMVKTSTMVSNIELKFEVLNAISAPKETATITLHATVE